MLRKLLLVLCLLISMPGQARDFEDNYAVFGAGAQPCSTYLIAVQKGGNVIMPETYNILGETDFPMAQRWLTDHCRKYPNELFINAVARLTEVLYPMRFQSGLKNPPQGNPAKVDTAPEPAATKPQLKDVKIR